MRSRVRISSEVYKAAYPFNRASLLDAVEWIMFDIRLLHAQLPSRSLYFRSHIIQVHCKPKQSYTKRSFQMTPLYATSCELHVLVLHHAMTTDDLVQKLCNGWKCIGQISFPSSSARNYPTRDDRVMSIKLNVPPGWLMERTVPDPLALVRNTLFTNGFTARIRPMTGF